MAESNVLVDLSRQLADVVEQAQPWIVRVEARRRVGATGIVWSADGLIVTADHVVERDEEITVGLSDGRELPARLVGRDQSVDLAVLKVEASGLPAAQPAQQPAKTGNVVLALGRPFGGNAMASLGIVSAVGGQWRSWRGGSIEGIVRSDVTLYPGFSGGPLVDGDGRLIGVNSSILARGLAVAIPHAAIGKTVAALTSPGGAKRGYLGIASQPVKIPEGLRQALGLQQQSGLLVLNVEPGSPAERAGFLLGDTLISFAGQPTTEPGALLELLGPGSAGKEESARVIRAGQLAALNVQIGER